MIRAMVRVVVFVARGPGLSPNSFQIFWAEVPGSIKEQGLNRGQTSSQCYKSFTGLYLEVCKTGLFLKSIIASRFVKFNMLMPVIAFEYKFFQQKSMIIWN